MAKVKKKVNRKKWDSEQFELVRVVWDEATADESWMSLEDAAKLGDAEIESHFPKSKRSRKHQNTNANDDRKNSFHIVTA